jgi:hypothetical protein
VTARTRAARAVTTYTVGIHTSEFVSTTVGDVSREAPEDELDRAPARRADELPES